MTANPNPRPEPESFLSVRALSKRYGALTALREVGLDIARGEFICFLGPSGCGKTTLLRAIAGLDPQSEGQILLEGRDISRDPPERRGFGIVFQSYALFPNLSVLDNVAYGLAAQGQTKVERETRARELLQTVGLEALAAKYPGQCSGGQQQRVALARALAPRPNLLLLDEPLSALDARVRLQLRAEIKRLQEQLGVTTIMVTHDQEEALTMADRIVVMNQGRIEQTGSPLEVYERPASRFVAEFVGAMNFVNAVVLDELSLRIGSLTLRLPLPIAHAAGSKVTAALRPEHLQLTDEGLPARLTEREFLGSQVRVWLELEDGSSAQAVLAPDAARQLPPQGSTVQLRWPVEHLHVYPATA